MIKVENIDVWGFEHAIRGMRNPMNSWDKSDSYVCDTKHCDSCKHQESGCWKNPDGAVIGKNDADLMHRLYKAGTEHRKYLRQIFVSMDITAPLYWWKEFDTYKIGTTSNSCSTMHKIHSKEFTLDDFSNEHLFGEFKPIEHKEYEPINFLTLNTQNIVIKSDTVLLITIEALNFYRHRYLETKDKDYWWQMIQLLPSSYNQKRTITMNYENVINILNQRCNHKLDEWREFCDILSKLPHLDEITTKQDDGMGYTE